MTRKYCLWFCFGLYLFVAPYSLSQLPFADEIKFVRVGLLGLAILFGLAILQRYGLAISARSIVIFGLFHTFSALWSANPAWGFFLKSMFTLAVIAGALTAYALHDLRDLGRFFRFISVLGLIAGVYLFLLYLRSPDDAMVMDRLAPGRINANLVGLSLSLPMVCTFQQALVERRVIWRIIHSVGFMVLLWALFATGSRGSVVMTLAGTAAVLIPFLRGKGLANLVFIALAMVVIFQSGQMIVGEGDVSTEGAQRITSEMTKNTRADNWAFAWKRFTQSPAIGWGWLHSGKSYLNFMNVYIQVLAEGGVLGGLIFLGCFSAVAYQSIRLLRSTRMDTLELASYKFLVAGIFWSIMLHGVFESSTLLGTTTSTLFLGLACGLIDKLNFVVHFVPGPGYMLPVFTGGNRR